MNDLEAKLLKCLFLEEAANWFMGRTFIRFMRRSRCLSVCLTITLILPLVYVISIPLYAIYATSVGAIGCLVLFLVLLLLLLSSILHLFIFLSLVIVCVLVALFTLTIGMYILPVVLTCYDRSRFILHMKLVESTFSAFPQIVVMIVFLTEFPAGPGVIVSLSCSCVSLAFAFVKAFWIDSCHDAADFRSEVGTFRRRSSHPSLPRTRKRTTSSRSDAYHECGDEHDHDQQQQTQSGMMTPEGATAPDPYAFPPQPPPAYPSLDMPISRSFGEVSAV